MLLAPEVNGLCYQWLLLESFLTCTEWADRPSRCWLASDQSVTSGLSSHWQWQEACCASSVHVFLPVTWKKAKSVKSERKQVTRSLWLPWTPIQTSYVVMEDKEISRNNWKQHERIQTNTLATHWPHSVYWCRREHTRIDRLVTHSLGQPHAYTYRNRKCQFHILPREIVKQALISAECVPKQIQTR